MALGDALSNPHDVATFLFLKLHKGIKDTKVELVQEGQLVELHLMLKESVLQGFVSRIATCTLKKQFVFRVVISYILDLFIVISPSQLSQALRVESATVWKELGTVLLGQLCAERVDGDDEGAAVCFKL